MNKFQTKLNASLFCKVNHKIFHPFLLSYTSNYSSTGTPKTTATSKSKLQQIQRIQSSVSAGTILKGLNFYKNGTDPIALLDDEYPDWLWEILDKEKEKQLRNNDYSRQHHRKQRRELIKNNNFDRSKKK